MKFYHINIIFITALAVLLQPFLLSNLGFNSLFAQSKARELRIIYKKLTKTPIPNEDKFKKYKINKAIKQHDALRKSYLIQQKSMYKIRKEKALKKREKKEEQYKVFHWQHRQLAGAVVESQFYQKEAQIRKLQYEYDLSKLPRDRTRPYYKQTRNVHK